MQTRSKREVDALRPVVSLELELQCPVILATPVVTISLRAARVGNQALAWNASTRGPGRGHKIGPVPVRPKYRLLT